MVSKSLNVLEAGESARETVRPLKGTLSETLPPLPLFNPPPEAEARDLRA